LGHFPKKNPANGCQNESKTDPFKPGFQLPISIGNVVKAYWWGLGGKRSSDGLVVRAHVSYLFQNRPKNRDLAPTQATGFSFFPPNFASSLVI